MSYTSGVSSSENWDQIVAENSSLIKDEELDLLYDSVEVIQTEKNVVIAKVMDVVGRDVIVNLGGKSDGLIPVNEFKDKDLGVGDEIEVYVEKHEDKRGYIQVSYRKANAIRSWQRIEEAQQSDTILEGVIKRRTKGGLIVNIYGIEAFLPGSQIDVSPIRDFDLFLNKRMELKVLNINHKNENIIVSHKILIEKDLEEQRQAILGNLEKGQILEGSVKNMTNFGAFIDLGGVDGLLHITDIIWGRISHPNQILDLDQKITVIVLGFDEHKKRISLGMKQLQDDPWKSLPESFDKGLKVKGRIVNIMNYGVFVEVVRGVEGLIHVSEMSWSQHPIQPHERFKVGEEIEAVLLHIDREDRKMSLGIKQLTPDPWQNEAAIGKYVLDSIHEGTIRNVTPFGFFLELEEGIDGLLHISDLSWTEKVKHPSQFAQIGTVLKVKVLSVNRDERRLALGHKQIEKNPWEAFEEIFAPDSVHQGTIIATIDKGAIVELQFGLKAFCFNKNLVLENGKLGDLNDVLPFKVLNFSKEDKKVLVSHIHTYVEELQPKVDENAETPAPQEDAAPATLGDIASFKDVQKTLEDKKPS